MTVQILFLKSEMDFAEKHLKIVSKEPISDLLTRCTIELDSPTSVHEIWHTAIKFYIQKSYNANISSTPLAPVL